ncbi:MAG TPA: MBL fold metallo-hydrolase [Acidimicrobiales bacterium]|nr:MBL fold metallo-hydrolase [Acidimicrobiales bacterium]
METFRAAPDIDVITTSIAIPGLGLIPVNSFVVHGSEPLLVDTGPVVESGAFMEVLRSVIDPAELRWIWLTHPDFDHIGALHELVESNPRLRVITTFLGVGLLGLFSPLSPDRLFLVNPGQTITLGDRTLEAWKPPVFDNPSTTALRDPASGVVWSSDCFGAVLPEVPQRADDIDDKTLREGQVFWATVDSPWLHGVDPAVFGAKLQQVRAMEPAMVLSSHLPPASGAMIERLTDALAAAPAASPFVGPDQAAMEAMMAAMAGGPS